MSAHHVDLPEQVVTPGEELWVKIIDLDLQRRRISLSIKQAAEGGVVAAEYQEHFGEHAYDDEGNYVGPTGEYAGSEGQQAWAEYFESEAEEGDTEGEAAPDASAASEEEAAPDAPAAPEGDQPVAEVADAAPADEPPAAPATEGDTPPEA